MVTVLTSSSCCSCSGSGSCGGGGRSCGCSSSASSIEGASTFDLVSKEEEVVVNGARVAG